MTAEEDPFRARQALYGVLQAVFRYPLTRAKLEPLRHLESGVPGIERSLAALREFCAGIDAWDRLVEELNVEYTRLLEGPGRAPAPPYASFYLNDGRLKGTAWLAARRRYAEQGLVVEDADGTPEDHITLELAFMSHLSAVMAEAVSRQDREQAAALIAAAQAFLRDHMLPWLPGFCSNVRAGARQPFFIMLADLLDGVLANDMDWLGVEAGTICQANRDVRAGDKIPH